MNIDQFAFPPGSNKRLRSYDTASTGSYRKKEEALEKLAEDVSEIARMQDVLFAQDVYALLLIFQAMDAAGKDSAIKHVMSGVNPQGCDVHSFKAPSAEELDHDYLWRCMRALPERGRIGIFNRSYYEEVLVVRVHPEFLTRQKLPPQPTGKAFWKARYEEINHFERYLVRNGIVVMKFFLHVSKEEQRKRFLARIDEEDKNWKFSAADAKEREHWKDYMRAYEETFRHTSTSWAPWYIVPADHKWYSRIVVSEVIVKTLRALKMTYPTPTGAHQKELRAIRKRLMEES
ncbi:MAG: polyphosphate kinase 2 family protein [Bacteroidetes bacterium]|jgi:PPK2 family polyphosphate:nucleotide phosphotransferase|nr:polyphosphate kinase 2 family protein [Bacteroidota bacterium]